MSKLKARARCVADRVIFMVYTLIDHSPKPTLLAEPFVSNERLCGNRVNFLLSMRKVSLWLTSTFSRRFSKQVLYARATRQLNHFLTLPMKTFSCFKFQGNVSWDGYTLLNFLLTTVSPFCPIRGRGFVKMKQTLQMWRVQLKSRVPPARALFDNVLIFGLPTKNNACAVKTGLTTENRSD